MIKIKMCGLSRLCDIDAANELLPEYIGFVYASRSRRCVSPDKSKELRDRLDPRIKAVGVFVNEKPENVAWLLNDKIIDIAQLHGTEDISYIETLRKLSNKPIIQAFTIRNKEDIENAVQSTADYILLDSGAGSGDVFDWRLIENVNRDYFLAGGLSPDNVDSAIHRLQPYAVDVSSGIETDGVKDKNKMKEFVSIIRKG